MSVLTEHAELKALHDICHSRSVHGNATVSVSASHSCMHNIYNIYKASQLIVGHSPTRRALVLILHACIACTLHT